MIGISSSIEWIIKSMGAVPRQSHGRPISFLTTDSRNCTISVGVLFFCLNGERHDGHAYVNELYLKGIRWFAVRTASIEVGLYPKACFLEVPDTLKALQKLAGAHRARFGIDCIAITGSNGKTVVKEWVSRALSEEVRTVRSPGSYNSQVGVPLSLLRICPEDKVGIFEAGISKPGEMARLETIIRPDTVLLTHFGTAHSENFKDPAALASEKTILLKQSKTVIYSSDYPEWTKALTHFKGERITVSKTDRSAELFYTPPGTPSGMAEVEMIWHGKILKMRLPATDAGSLENASLAVATLLHIGLSPETIAERTERFTQPEWRLELIEAGNESLLLSDVYNADLNSLENALDFANVHRNGRQLTLVLTDLPRGRIPIQEYYSLVADLISRHGVGRLLVIGPELAMHMRIFPKFTKHFTDVDDMIASSEFAFHREMAVFKGARVFRLERAVEKAATQSHLTRLFVDLNALEQNLNTLRSKAGGGIGTVAVVKASAYGTGSAEIATVLEHNRVDYLAVAFADEGVQLRKAGISTPIMVLNMVFGTDDLMIRHRLEPEIFSLRVLSTYAEAAVKANPSEPLPVHLKLDTGMHRLGLVDSELNEAIDILRNHERWIKAVTCFSHLAAADNPLHDEFTRKQISDFAAMASHIEVQLGSAIHKHISNTAAVGRFPEARFDMVRLGIGLYGVGEGLVPVHRLVSVITMIKTICAGESVGYDRSFIAERDTRVAVVAAGYADGYPRALSNGRGVAYIASSPAPVIGRVCMDMLMLDVTDIAAREGDEVELFGPWAGLEVMARAADRIPYEILTGIAPRVKRIYLRQS